MSGFGESRSGILAKFAQAGALAICFLIGQPAFAQGFDIPTGAPPSPLFGAESFTQPLLRFEEFGTQPVPTTICDGCDPLPEPVSCRRSPSAADIDAFLSQPLNPPPTREANTDDPNPWAAMISSCVRPLTASAAEGRPPGEWYSHQRWDEFLPEVYFHTATLGARDNTGLRDSSQRHGYAHGEFGPGGLYHFNGSADGTQVRFHPDMPVQHRDALWTFDGTLPPKLLVARMGEPILFRHYNALPVDVSANFGFGMHTLTTHNHNGHNPAESDGFFSSYFFPGQYYDYRWPMILAGHDYVNTDASDPRAATPDGAGGTIRIPGDWRETMSTHWFHDHMEDHTAENVYKGSAAMFNIYSAVDRGHESLDCNYEDEDNVNLCFPSGTSLDWGNRDYDVNLLVADKAWDQFGQLWFNPFDTDGFLGDQVLTNWQWHPYLEVRARRYRFRILNGAVARYFRIAIVTEDGDRVPFHMIANDGNILQHAIPFPNAESQDLPTQGIAERYDIIIDFSQFEPGTRIRFINTMAHGNGRGPEGVVPLNQILNGNYQGDPAVGQFFELRVVDYDGVDTSMDPNEYEPGGRTMVPLPTFTQEEFDTAIHRHFEFGRSDGTDDQPWTIRTDGGLGMTAVSNRLTAAPVPGALEIWHLRNGAGGGWSHPVHIHFEEGQIIGRDGAAPPIWERFARKDLYRIGPEQDSSREVTVAIRFREFVGSYMEHCHNTIHEDNAMLMRYDINNPSEMLILPSPNPTWEGVAYDPSTVLPSYRLGDQDVANSFLDYPFTPERIRYVSRRGRWVVRGATTFPPGSRVRIYIGDEETGTLLANRRVRADQTFRYRIDDSTLLPDSTGRITLVSDQGGAPFSCPIDIR